MLFAVIHVYMVFREDIMSGESVIGTMINGIRMWKRAPKTVAVAAAAAPRRSAAAGREPGGPASRPRRASRRVRASSSRARYLKPLGINQTELARALDISRRRVNELVNGRRAITPDTAVRLALYFGNDAMFWMHLQVAWDMHVALREMRAARRK